MVTLSKRARKRLLIGVNAVLAAGLAATFAAALWPSRQSPAALAAGRPQSSAAAADAADVEPAAAYAVIYERDVRLPLHDPLPVKAAKPREPRLTIQLTGTVIEPGSSLGLFRTSDKRHKFAGVGDTVEGAEVLSILEGEATVSFGGRTFTLKVPRKGPG